MAVYSCSGCGRHISLSAIPGGNPIANEDPGSWAQNWRICPACSVLFCEICADPGSVRCPKCDGKLEEPTAETRFAMTFTQFRKAETEADLPYRIRRRTTKEERLGHLDSDFIKQRFTVDEIEAFRKIIDAATYQDRAS